MIYLNDILQFKDLKKVKIRFNLNFGNTTPPIDYFTMPHNQGLQTMLNGQYWNYAKKGNFSKDDITLGFIPLPNKPECWLLFHIGQVTKDLGLRNAVGYEYNSLTEYNKFIGRVVIRFKNKSQNLVRCGNTTLDQCYIEEILPQVYSDNNFPGYNHVNVSWHKLAMLIDTPSWKTALENQKGVYLLIDRQQGKFYVGSAYGENMLYARWKNYIDTCHGGNIGLKKLNKDYIKDNFYFSILETFNHNVQDQLIIDREAHWKEVMRTREFGYNEN